MQTKVERECNKIWEPLMAKVMCPSSYKSFSHEGLEYIKGQLDRIKDKSLRLALSEMIYDCEVIIGNKTN